MEVLKGGICAGMGRIKFAMVCAANQNRSMEAHALLKEHGFEVALVSLCLCGDDSFFSRGLRLD